ncbi:MAG: DUF5060 domain-containing protein [Planctomycetota bacterium]|jgi:hypothetical protein
MPYLCLRTVVCVLACVATAQAAEVVDFTLINAQTDRDIRTLSDGDAIDLAKDGGKLSIRANLRGKAGSVRFALDGNKNHLTENVPPFATHGDSQGDYNAWTPSPGKHTVTATPFSGRGASGTLGKPKTITFTVVGTAPPSNVPARKPASQFPDIRSEEDLGTTPPPTGGTGVVTGELMRWHKVTITFDGPQASETGKPNPCLHYRLNVTLSQDDASFVVPGYFAGDGNGGAESNKWRVHFSPPKTGTWNYRASFRAGFQVNVSTDSQAGRPTACDGARGSFQVAGSDRSGRDFRSGDKGLLKNRGHHYLTFGGSGKPWVKGGPDIPENFFGYDGFDNTPRARHRYRAHAPDWRPGDPDFAGGKGKRIIGALNFIAGYGGNCIYFLPMNIGGDGKDTFPTIEAYDKTRYDVSKLDQWEIVFAHAQARGIFLHFQLAETESDNENYHDDGNLGPERKLYYRELIARFSHHNGLEFDLGEENDYGPAKRKQFAAYIKAVDPYDHPVTTHTHGGKYESFYGPLLGTGDFDITAFQGGNSRTAMANLIAEWRKRSAAAGVKWAISFDEPQKIENDPNDPKAGYPQGRRDKMWPLYMSGGAGFEWYIQEDGGGHSLDHRLEDFREMESALKWTGYALEFLDGLPLLEMEPDHQLGSSSREDNTYVLAKRGEVYALYNDRNGGDFSLDLRRVSGTFEVKWFDPRHGGGLKDGTVKTVDGRRVVDLGSAPESVEQDWACLVRKRDR